MTPSPSGCAAMGAGVPPSAIAAGSREPALLLTLQDSVLGCWSCWSVHCYSRCCRTSAVPAGAQPSIRLTLARDTSRSKTVAENIGLPFFPPFQSLPVPSTVNNLLENLPQGSLEKTVCRYPDPCDTERSTEGKDWGRALADK